VTVETGMAAPTDGLAISLRGLRKSYGSHVALAGLDLNVAALAVVAWLIGAVVLSALFTERAEIAG
jgi:hypothetical protein